MYSLSRVRASRNRFAAAGSVLVTFLSAHSAWAGNDDEVLIGSDAVLTGGAVSAYVSDGASLWYNPAGLAAVKNRQVDVTGTAYTLRVWTIPDYLEAPNGQTADGNTYEALTIPTAITYVRNFGGRWSAGFGYFLSRWSDIRGHSDLSFPDNGSEAVWQTGYVQTYSLHNAILGASYAVSDDFRFGFELIGFYNGVNYSWEFSGGIADLTEASFVTGTEQGLQSHWGLQLGAGLQWSVTRNVNIGLAVRSPAVGLLNFYEQQAYYTLGFDAAQVPGIQQVPDPSQILQYDVVVDDLSEWKVSWVLPPRFRLGFAHITDDFLWSIDVDFQPGIHSQGVVVGTQEFFSADRKPVFNARVGGQYALTDLVSVGAGLFTDRASSESISIGEGVFDFYGLAGGVELSNVHRMDESAPADKIRFSTTMGIRYALGIGHVQSVTLPEFYDFLGEIFVNPSGDIEQRSARAWANELTFNLGGGLYF